MNLIYICVFHQENYINLLKILMTSLITRGNINAGSYFGFIPPTLVLNYIMYNENQITGSYDVSTPPPPLYGKWHQTL